MNWFFSLDFCLFKMQDEKSSKTFFSPLHGGEIKMVMHPMRSESVKDNFIYTKSKDR